MRTENMYMEDEDLLLEFQTTRRLKPQTMKGYQDAIRIYSNFNGLTMVELLKEAMNEEDERIPWRKRTLKKRLEEFRVYLYDEYAKSTAEIHFSRIKTIYFHFQIELHRLPTIQVEDGEPPITYKDLPTKEIFKKALNISIPMVRAMILFMLSSGCAKKETRHLTIQDFIDATREYHNSNDIIEVVNAIKDRDDIVPIFHLKRFKTKKWFYTCCTPEATNAIIYYLIKLINNHVELKPDYRIFGVNKDYFSNYFKEINTALGLGKVRKFNRFTSHMLRRYHASTLEAAGMDKETVNTLQGKSQTITNEAYFKTNPQALKGKYVKFMSCLYVNFDIEEVKPEEYIRLENENTNLKNNLRSILERIERLEQK